MARRGYSVLLAAAILTIVSGIIHGFMAQRWGTDERMQRAARQLGEVPSEFGEWVLVEEKPLSSTALTMLQCAGYLNHVYEHKETKQKINVTVMVGPGSTMAVHTPEICYESRNFSLLGDKRKVDVEIADSNHALWAVDFQTNDITKQNLRVYYGWSNGGPWSAPTRPRLAFAGERVLFKMQIAEYGVGTGPDRDDSVLRFVNIFLPELQNGNNESQN